MSEKILVTGATGFIGSHLTELLVEKGYSVIAFDRYNSNNNWGWLDYSNVKNHIEVILGDIRDFDSVAKSMSGCTSVFHLAALIGIPYSYVSPLAYIRTNIEGTYNILEASKNQDLENILITSTSETYGSAQYIPIDEKHPLVGQSPYSASKIAADQMAISYYNSFNLPIKIIRPFNTYGPRQSARAIIPTVIGQFLSESRDLKVGNLSPKRDLTYVKDTVSGFFSIYKSEELIGKVTNIGMNDKISINGLIAKIKSLMNVKTNIVQDSKRVRPEKSEVDQLQCDNTFLKANTQWKPKYSLETGLEQTINWMRENLSVYKTNKYNI